MIQCPNYSCQAINAEAHQFCHQCQAPLPRRFLWAVGHRVAEIKPGTLIADRYLCKAPQIFLDTKPGLPPGTLAEIPFSVLPYLRLTPHRLNLPQVYGWADGTLESGEMTRLLFLENSALSISALEAASPPHILPSLQESWASGSAFQQLHWLWQMAHLWQPLAAEHIASTLLVPELIRVEASLIRLIQLHPPQTNERDLPQLQQLGRWWQSLKAHAHPSIQVFLQQLCLKLEEAYFQDSQALVTAIELGLGALGRSRSIELTIATQTDKGPSRANNQDACFPASGTVRHQTLTPTQDAEPPQTSAIVVCDGIGGHQGGEIASATAIDEITKTFDTLELPSPEDGLSPWVVHDQINVAIAQANDAINQRNNDEQRRERARMGTTVVMGLIHDHDCYLAHVGDSRVYWIDPLGCHQITLDDDVASREARLGYGTYRSVLYHPNSGALVQALGMGPSKNLYPSSQHIILGEEGLLLFCSDGLSDQDLIETCWASVLLPLFASDRNTSDPNNRDELPDLGKVVQALTELANTRNGHDNVTIGLVQWNSKQTGEIHIPDLDHLILQHNERVNMDSPAVGNADVAPSMPKAAPPSSTLFDATAQNSEASQRTAFPQEAFDQTASSPDPESRHASESDGEAQVAGPETLDLSPANEDIPWISPASRPKSSRHSPLLFLMVMCLGMMALASIVGGALYFGVPSISDRINAALGINNDTVDPPTLPPAPDPIGSDDRLTPDRDQAAPSIGSQNTEEAIAVGHILNVRTSAPIPRSLPPPDTPEQGNLESQEMLFLFDQPPPPGTLVQAPEVSVTTATPLPIQPLGSIPWGSILQVQNTVPLEAPEHDASLPTSVESFSANSQTDSAPSETLSARASEPELAIDEPLPPSVDDVPKDDWDRWVQVQLCFIPTDSGVVGAVENEAMLSLGSTGWISERQLKEVSYRDIGQSLPNNEYCSDVP